MAFLLASGHFTRSESHSRSVPAKFLRRSTMIRREVSNQGSPSLRGQAGSERDHHSARVPETGYRFRRFWRTERRDSRPLIVELHRPKREVAGPVHIKAATECRCEPCVIQIRELVRALRHSSEERVHEEGSHFAANDVCGTEEIRVAVGANDRVINDLARVVSAKIRRDAEGFV